MAKVKEDRIMRTMREFGLTGPITREDYYLNFLHATDDPQELDAEMESLPPEHLQDWEQFHATRHIEAGGRAYAHRRLAGVEIRRHHRRHA
jgi:hypothetical protein